MSAILNELFEESNDVFSNPAEFRLKTRFFLNNTVDMVVHRIKHRIPKTKEAVGGFFGVSYPKTLTDEERQEKDEENLKRAVRRARQTVHFAVRQIGADHLLTLTTRENIQDKEEFFEVFTKFVRLVREKSLVHSSRLQDNKLKLLTNAVKRDWLYVAVPELQERGAYHMHIACVGKQDIAFLRACWYVALGGDVNDSGENTKGAVNVRAYKKRFSGVTETYKTFGLVRYLTKYIDKDFEKNSELGKHRYKVSRQVKKPKTIVQNMYACYANGQGFFEAMQECIKIANFYGIKPDFTVWNKGEDLFLLRGALDD